MLQAYLVPPYGSNAVLCGTFVIRWSPAVWNIDAICIYRATISHLTFINFDNFFAVTFLILFISGMADTMIFLFGQRKAIRWSRTWIISTNVVCIIYSIMSTDRIKPSWESFCAEFRTWWTFVFCKVGGRTLSICQLLPRFSISFIMTRILNWWDKSRWINLT